MTTPQKPSPEVDAATFNQATTIVERAILRRGDVASLKTTTGNIKSFEDTLCSGIWSDYLILAMGFVDGGQWQEAHARTRTILIGRTAQTLLNQR